MRRFESGPRLQHPKRLPPKGGLLATHFNPLLSPSFHETPFPQVGEISYKENFYSPRLFLFSNEACGHDALRHVQQFTAVFLLAP